MSIFCEGEQEYPLDIWSSDKGSGHRIVILSPHWWNVIWSLIGRELWESPSLCQTKYSGHWMYMRKRSNVVLYCEPHGVDQGVDAHLQVQPLPSIAGFFLDFPAVWSWTFGLGIRGEGHHKILRIQNLSRARASWHPEKQLLHSLSAAPHPSPSQAVYVDRHMLVLMNYFLADVMMYKMFGQSNIQIYQRLSCCSCW